MIYLVRGFPIATFDSRRVSIKQGGFDHQKYVCVCLIVNGGMTAKDGRIYISWF
jgi:hypothetical protein